MKIKELSSSPFKSYRLLNSAFTYEDDATETNVT